MGYLKMSESGGDSEEELQGQGLGATARAFMVRGLKTYLKLKNLLHRIFCMKPVFDATDRPACSPGSYAQLQQTLPSIGVAAGDTTDTGSSEDDDEGVDVGAIVFSGVQWEQQVGVSR